MNDTEKKILKIAARAAKEAQMENLRKGIPNVYSKNMRLYFQLSDGTITQEIPEEYKKLEEKQN